MNTIEEKEAIAYLIVNFGGPRDLEEVEGFLISLLTDQEVIQTPFPRWLHKLLFTRVAKKRSKVIVHDYAAIGGKSPIYEDTEQVAKEVQKYVKGPVFTFHRYLPNTHSAFLENIKNYASCYSSIQIFPLFPQFSYATTGSIALWLSQYIQADVLKKLRWIKSYPIRPSYLNAFTSAIQQELCRHCWKEEETILLFSAHGLPQEYVDKADPYEKECRFTFEALSSRFPRAHSKLCYQSQFGKKEWLRPYTNEVCASVDQWGKGFKNALVIPLSFTSDHIETLFEIEQQYVPVLKQRGFNTFRCPALNLRTDWIEAIVEMLVSSETVENETLLRQQKDKLK